MPCSTGPSAAFRSGDLPAALSFLDEAAARYRPLNVPTPASAVDRCAVLLAAGLATDALAEADTALGDIEQARGRSTKKAELLLMAANCALAAAQPQAALDRARAAQPPVPVAAERLVAGPHAGLVLVAGAVRGGPVSAQLLREASQAAARLEALGSGEAAQAHLLAGRVALDLGRRQTPTATCARRPRSRRRGPALSRASGWLSEALRAEAAADPRRLLAACRRGLGGPGRAPAHPGRLGAAGAGHRARRRAGRARAAARGAARAGPGCCWPGASAGGPPRWPSRRSGPRPTRSSAASLAALREVTSRLEDARRQGTARRRCSSGSSGGSKDRCGPRALRARGR